ncbi:hypothetical protein BSNK01_20070 [Bacillaceae bacterium]
MKKWRWALWRVWDLFYPKAVGLRHIDKDGRNIFRVALRKYRGPVLYASDGSIIRPGDIIGELHLYNLVLWEKLQRTNNEVRWAMIALQEVRRSLPALAAFLRHDPQGKRMKALIARTILHRGARQLGFEVQDIPPGLYAKIKIPYLRWIFKFCHPNGDERLKRSETKLVPKYVFIPREKLISLYGAPAGINEKMVVKKEYPELGYSEIPEN